MRVYYQQLFFLSLLVSTECLAQTSTENYIATETMLDANGASSIKSVQYYNGLGYPTVSVATTGGGGQTACSLPPMMHLDGKRACTCLFRQVAHWITCRHLP